MGFVKINFERDITDAEAINEIRSRIRQINNYIQHPDRDNLTPLLGDDLQQRYGRERVFEMADAALWGGNDVVEGASATFTRLFETFNRRYFEGKLPPHEVVVRLAISYYGRTVWRAGRSIELLAGSEPRMVARLLDEMAYIAANDGYDSKSFRAEIERLSLAGAPLDVPDGMDALTADQFIALMTTEVIHEVHEPPSD
jgi:hypothetical protein